MSKRACGFILIYINKNIFFKDLLSLVSYKSPLPDTKAQILRLNRKHYKCLLIHIIIGFKGYLRHTITIFKLIFIEVTRIFFTDLWCVQNSERQTQTLTGVHWWIIFRRYLLKTNAVSLLLVL